MMPSRQMQEALGLKVPDDIQQLVANIDQHIKIQVGVNTSIDEIYESQDPMLQQLVKGFSFSAQV